MKITKTLEQVADLLIGTPITRYRYRSGKDEKAFEYTLFSQNMLSPTGLAQTVESDLYVANTDLTKRCTNIGDVVYGLRTPNHAVSIDAAHEGFLVQSYMCIIRCHEQYVLPEYLAFYLNTDHIKRQLYKHLQGTSIALLNIQQLKKVQLQLPSLAQQQQIIDLMQAGFQEVDVLRQLIKKKQTLLKGLVESL